MLADGTEGLRDDRHLRFKAGRGPLPVEGILRRRYEAVDDEIGRLRLDPCNRAGKVRCVERKQFRPHDPAAGIGDVFTDPAFGDLAENIISAENIDLLAEALHRMWNQRAETLAYGRAGHERIAVAYAAFIWLCVEVGDFAAIEDRPHDFARRAGDGAEDRRDPVAQGQLLRVLRIKLVVRLCVVGHQRNLASQQSAGGVRFVDDETEHIAFRPTLELEQPGDIVEGADFDIGFRRKCATGAKTENPGCCDSAGGEKLATAKGHRTVLSSSMDSTWRPASRLRAHERDK